MRRPRWPAHLLLRYLECSQPECHSAPPPCVRRSQPPEGEGPLRMQDLAVAGVGRQTWELCVRNQRCVGGDGGRNKKEAATAADLHTLPASSNPAREYQRNFLYTGIRLAIMLAVGVVFATLFLNQGQKYSTYLGEAAGCSCSCAG